MVMGFIGNVHKSVAASFKPRKMTLPSYITSHLSSSNVTVHPALQSGRMPINEATARFGTTRPTRIVGSPGIMMSHVCVDITRRPSGKLIVIGRSAIFLLTTSAFSMMNIDVAPVSAIACVDAMVRAFKHSCEGLPNSIRAVEAMLGALLYVLGTVDGAVEGAEQFDVTTVASSSSRMLNK